MYRKSLFTFAAWFLASTALVAADQKTKILLIGKDLDHPRNTHTYLSDCELLAKCLRQTRDVETVVSNGWPKDPEILKNLKAIVLHTRLGGTVLFRGPQRRQAEEMLKKGIGITAIHWGTGAETPEGEPWLRAMGGWFNAERDGFSRYLVQTSRLRQADPTHPVCRGWKDYDLREEYYFKLRFLADARPVTTTTIEGTDYPVGWVYERPNSQGGRSFGFVGGHFHDNFGEKAFRQAIVNGILWTAHIEVPENGAPISITARDMELPPDPPRPGAQVTLKGSLVCNGACIPDPKKEDHRMVVFAIDGTGAVRAEVDRIMKEFYPERGLDGDAAQKLMDQFSTRLKFYLAPDSPALLDAKNTGKNHYCMPALASAVTGVISEKDGKRWITANRIEPARLQFPDRMLAAEKPFVMPDKPPVVLKIDNRFTLKCVYIPPGKFLMGTPVYMWPYFMEEYPHRVTLTRPFYLAEIPITQEMYEAVMGNNPSTVKNPQLPVQNPTFADVQKFCRILGEKNGKTVRLPTDAEWEYAARVGTSNPGFQEKYREQNSTGPSGFKAPLPVKSKAPNAWGLYDMASSWWEISADKGMYNVRHDDVDPHYAPGVENARSQRSGRGIVKDGWSIGTHEFIAEKPDYAGQKFRVLVEVR